MCSTAHHLTLNPGPPAPDHPHPLSQDSYQKHQGIYDSTYGKTANPKMHGGSIGGGRLKNMMALNRKFPGVKEKGDHAGSGKLGKLGLNDQMSSFKMHNSRVPGMTEQMFRAQRRAKVMKGGMEAWMQVQGHGTIHRNGSMRDMRRPQMADLDGSGRTLQHFGKPPNNPSETLGSFCNSNYKAQRIGVANMNADEKKRNLFMDEAGNSVADVLQAKNPWISSAEINRKLGGKITTMAADKAAQLSAAGVRGATIVFIAFKP